MKCCAFGLDLFEPGIVKYLGECRVSGVCERIRPTLATVRDKSPDGHGLHIPRRNSDRGVIDAGRRAEQDHPVHRPMMCEEQATLDAPQSWYA